VLLAGARRGVAKAAPRPRLGSAKATTAATRKGAAKVLATAAPGQTTTITRRTTIPKRKEENDPAGAGGGASTGREPAADPGSDPLQLEGAAFSPPDEPGVPVDVDDDYEPPPPEPLEWTPERAAALVKGGGLLLHVADPLGHEPGGDELWRATEQDALDIGAPLARILNRYAPARRLAGVADEGELAFATLAYAKRNLVLRGRLVRERKAAEEAAAARGGTELFERDQPTE
jgi:hypothetical protein